MLVCIHFGWYQLLASNKLYIKIAPRSSLLYYIQITYTWCQPLHPDHSLKHTIHYSKIISALKNYSYRGRRCFWSVESDGNKIAFVLTLLWSIQFGWKTKKSSGETMFSSLLLAAPSCLHVMIYICVEVGTLILSFCDAYVYDENLKLILSSIHLFPTLIS